MTWLDDVEFSTVILHTIHNGPSYRGIREAVYDDGVLLSSVMNLDEETGVVEAGLSFFPRDQVHRIQILGAA